jgi:parallel beta-helix repeat protein
MSELTAAFDRRSPTSGIQAAIDALGAAGGRVRLPAGRWRLRQSVELPSRVSLVGDGPATELVIRRPHSLPLAAAARRGVRSVRVGGQIPFRPGDAVGLCGPGVRHGWHGTHAVVAAVDGDRVFLDRPVHMGLSLRHEARIVSLFPGITARGAEDAEVRDLTLRCAAAGRVWWDFTYSAVHLDGCRRIRILNVTVVRWPSDGIGVQRGSDVQVAHCQAHGCRGHGFHPGTGLARSVWSHNIGVGNGSDGFFFCARVHDSVCSDSVFTGNGLSGIGGVARGGDHHNIISDNVCSENARWGIEATDGVEHVITGNLLRSNSQERAGAYPALRLHNAQRFLVQGNRCADDQQRPTQTQGIVESGSSDSNLISGNLCAGMATPVLVVGAHSHAEGNLS